MNCSCSFSSGSDYDPVVILDECYRRARKPYTCLECRRPIKRGDKYYYERFMNDGEFETVRTCLDCLSVRHNLVEIFGYGTIWELIEDSVIACQGDIPERCIAKLTPFARARVCDLMEAEWSIYDD